MNKLPNLYVLRGVPVVGYLLREVPPSIDCPECGRPLRHYEYMEFMIESRSECDLVTSTLGDFFASERFIAELQSHGVTGYAHQPVVTKPADDCPQSDNNAEYPKKVPIYHYLIITGQCDGPWLHNIKGEPCTTCGRPRPEVADSTGLTNEILGRVAPKPRLVYPETWHGEDFFYLSEPGLPLITERVASILEQTGNLRTEEIQNKDEVRRLMPRRAAILERKNWRVCPCAELGPAGWASSP